MAKVKFHLVEDFLNAIGYDMGSFCQFTGISKERMKEISDGGEAFPEEVEALAEAIGNSAHIIIEKP